jgi:hypothetical protein
MIGLLATLSFWDSFVEALGGIYGMIQDASLWFLGWMAVAGHNVLLTMAGPMQGQLVAFGSAMSPYIYPVASIYNVLNAWLPMSSLLAMVTFWCTWKAVYLPIRTVKHFIPTISG